MSKRGIKRGIKLGLQTIGLMFSGVLGVWVLSHKASELGGTLPACAIALAAITGALICWPRSGQ